jgi:hypothetical protein
MIIKDKIRKEILQTLLKNIYDNPGTLEKFIQKRPIGAYCFGNFARQFSGEKNQSIYLQILERAFYFIDLSLEDEKWRENPLPLLILRNELAKAYVGEKVDLEKIYMAI